MAKKIDIVLEGKYKGSSVIYWSQTNSFGAGGRVDKQTVRSYTVVDETNKNNYSFLKGAVGVALFGGLGAVAGLGGKKKKEYYVVIDWMSGEQSLIYIEDDTYKGLIKAMMK